MDGSLARLARRHPETLGVERSGKIGQAVHPRHKPKKSVVDWVRDGTYRIKQIAQQVQETWDKSINLSSLRKLFRVSKLSYKRIRKSCRHLRDPIAYAFFRGELQALRAWSVTGEVDLCYCDEMGISRQAVVPYGW